MSEEQDNPATEPTQEAPEPEVQEPSGGSEPEGKQFVDFKSLPPAVEARFRRIYGNMKEYERSLQESTKVNRALVERLEKLESGDLQNRITSLQQRQKEAFESGDYDKAQQITNELLDHKLAEKNKTRIEVPEVRTEPDNPLTDDQLDILAGWARETDDDGNALRPWANPQHKDHQRAFRYIQAAAMDPDFDLETQDGFHELLRAVDQKMTGKKEQPKSRVAAVLSGNGDGRPRSSERAPKLTPDELRVADGMGYTAKQYAEIKSKYGVK